MANEERVILFSDLIDRYRYLASVASETLDDTGGNSWNSVGIAKEMNDIAVAIRDRHPRQIDGFASLLDDPATAPWVAKHLLEVFDVDDHLERRAIATFEGCSDASYRRRRLPRQIRTLIKKRGGAV